MAVRPALNWLDPRLRQVILLHYYLGMRLKYCQTYVPFSIKTWYTMDRNKPSRMKACYEQERSWSGTGWTG